MLLAGGQGAPQALGMVPRLASKGPASAEGQLSGQGRARSCHLGYRGAVEVHGKVSGDPELHKSEAYIHICRSIRTHTTDNKYIHAFSDCVYMHLHVFPRENSIPFSRFSE